VRTVSEEAMAERLQAGDATRWILREHSLEQIACVLRGALTGFRQARLDERLGAHFGRGCIDDVDRGASETALNHPHELRRRKSLTVEIEEWLAHLPSVSGECQVSVKQASRCPSVAIISSWSKGANQAHSRTLSAIRRNPPQSIAIHRNQAQSSAIKRTQDHSRPLSAIRRFSSQSAAISRNQSQSAAITSSW
jgi:hypothetical protein